MKALAIRLKYLYFLTPGLTVQTGDGGDGDKPKDCSAFRNTLGNKITIASFCLNLEEGSVLKKSGALTDLRNGTKPPVRTLNFTPGRTNGLHPM